jgi:uncharacterized peroxidase-related enzyme
VRLAAVEQGHSRRAHLLLRTVRRVTGQDMDDVVRTALHRPQFWGRPFLGVLHAVMRGPSFWTPAEREYMAVVVSRLNECPFCVRAHTETARIESHGEVDAGDGSALRTELSAVLPLLEKVTTAPGTVTAADVAPVRAAGVPDDAVVDALHVALIFNTVNRLANALGWSWASDRHVQVSARAIHRLRYKLPGFVLR